MNVVLAVATFVGVLAGTSVSGGRVDYDGAIPLAALLALLVLVRRWPITILLLSVVAIMALRTGNLVDVGWVWPASVAYFAVAASDRPRRVGLPWAVGVGAFELLFAAAWESTVPGHGAGHALGAVGVETLWLALVIAAGAALRNRRRWQTELTASLQRLERERDLQSRQQVTEERLQIARELHDVVAHTLTVVGVQLRVATAAIDDSPDELREALRTAQHVRAKAVTDLRSLIDVLRDPDETGDEPVPPMSTLDDLDDLVGRTRAAGLDVAVEMTGDRGDVPAVVAVAVYRIVQESLTNTIRHSNAEHATVRIRIGADGVQVDVLDDGSGPYVEASTGHGIAGMRERVAALGGTFGAAPNPHDTGYSVRATIPVASSHS